MASVLARLRDRLVAWVSWLLLLLLGRLPRRRAVALGGWAGTAWARLGLARTAVARVNLRIAFPEWSEARRRRVLVGAFANLGRSIAEVAFLNRLEPETLDQVVRIEGLEYLQQARRSAPPGGVIALSAHFGNWELLAVAVALRGIPLAVVHRERTWGIESRIREWRGHSGTRLLPRGAAARAALRALRDGRVVAMLLDQDTRRSEGVFVPFFSRLACTRDAPARLAMRTGAPVVPVFIFRVAASDRHVVRFLPPLPMQPAGGEPEKAVRENVRRMNRVIEEAIRGAPDQWTWNHRRWRTQPPGEAHPYPRGSGGWPRLRLR